MPVRRELVYGHQSFGAELHQTTLFDSNHMSRCQILSNTDCYGNTSCQMPPKRCKIFTRHVQKWNAEYSESTDMFRKTENIHRRFLSKTHPKKIIGGGGTSHSKNAMTSLQFPNGPVCFLHLVVREKYSVQGNRWRGLETADGPSVGALSRLTWK